MTGKLGLTPPTKFGYNYMAARLFCDALAELPESRFVDAIVLTGSSVRPGARSKGKDIDLGIFLKSDLSDAEYIKARDAFTKQRELFEKKYGVRLCRKVFGGAGILPIVADARALYELKTVCARRKIMFCSAASRVKAVLERPKKRAVPKQRKPLRKPRPR